MLAAKWSYTIMLTLLHKREIAIWFSSLFAARRIGAIKLRLSSEIKMRSVCVIEIDISSSNVLLAEHRVL